MTFRTRFAPSPTGPLHLGHAYSAMLGFNMATAEGGEWLLRLEDIDRQRSKPEWEARLYEDLEWLGLWWPKPVMRQSDRLPAYRAALAALWERGLLFPCSCNRRDILEAASAPQGGGAPMMGPDGVVYPGTCRDEPRTGPLPDGAALRLDMRLALQLVGAPSFMEEGLRPGLIQTDAQRMLREVGDVVLARRDLGTSYHLAVTVDDAHQRITCVTRGEDLAEATPIHAVLQRLLGLRTPVYHHHRLIRDETGRRLAKREDAKAIRRFRDEGATPRDIRRMVGLDPSLAP